MSKKHDIIWLESVDSTNEEAKRHISDIDNLSVLSALEQTAGRGQRGNTWTSAPGENLMFSIVLKFSEEPDGNGESACMPLLPARDQFILNEIASLSVVDFLSQHGIPARIKWPNDIYVGSKKICGILIENSLRGSEISTSIIGIGLNINQRNFNVNLPNPTSMVLERGIYNSQGIPQNTSALSHCNSGLSFGNSKSLEFHSESVECHSERSEGSFDLSSCLNDFMDIFNAYVLRFLSVPAASPSKGTASKDLRRMYLSRLWRMDEPARFIDYASLPSGHLDGPMNIYLEGAESASPVFAGHSATDSGSSVYGGLPATEGRPFTGIIRGLSPIGHLLVEDLSTGELKEFAFKEIGYIL